MHLALECLIQRDVGLRGRDTWHGQNAVEDSFHKMVIINTVQLDHNIIRSRNKVTLHNLRDTFQLLYGC